ncbi:hypothetical protein AB1M95_01785 [Sulfitobacter sp. LCG007]
MTAVSLISPYAPQQVAAPAQDGSHSDAQTVQPASKSLDSQGAGTSSGQSGSGAGNGTGTGGSDHLAARQAQERASVVPQKATPKSVVDAQAHAEHVSKMREKVEENRERSRMAAEEHRRARDAEKREAANERRVSELDAQVEAAEAARADARLEAELAEQRKAQFPLPNPIPTAPILSTEA